MPNKNKPVPLTQVLADETGEQAIEKKLIRYGSAKQQTTTVASYIVDHVPEFRKYTKPMFDCASWLVFRNYTQININRIIKANFCKKHLLCGVCAMRRSALQVKSFEKILKQVLNENQNLIPLLITYTVKDGPDLQERFEHITSSRRKMTNRRRQAIFGSKTDTILKHIKGGAGSYEIKRGSGSGEWHPHMHEVALVDKDQFKFVTISRKEKDVQVPIQFENELRSEWKKQTGDSHMVDVRKIKMDDSDDMFGAICESFKYALKLNELSMADQVHAARVLQGKRLQFSYGLLHGVKINEELVDSIEDELELQPYVDMVYKFNNKKGKYKLHEITDFGDLKKEAEKEKEENAAKKRKKESQKTVSEKSNFSQDYVDSWIEDNTSENPTNTGIQSNSLTQCDQVGCKKPNKGGKKESIHEMNTLLFNAHNQKNIQFRSKLKKELQGLPF